MVFTVVAHLPPWPAKPHASGPPRGPPPKETWRQSVFVRIFLEAPQGASCGLSPCGAPDKLSAKAIGTDGVYRGNPSTTPNRKQA